MLKMIKFTLAAVFINCFLVGLCFAAKAEMQPRLALVIGNDDYKAKALKNAVRDAEDMDNILRKLGFKTILLKNADRADMVDAIRDFGRQLRKGGGAGLFYFAGHGVQMRGRNYLIPVKTVIETESDVEFEAVDAGRVLGKMQDAGNDVNILILDACRDNPFKSRFRSTESGLAQIDAPKGSFIAYATAPGKVAAEGDGPNGIFTTYLLKHIPMPNLTIEQVMNQTRLDVSKATSDKQIPWHSSSLIGDFILHKVKVNSRGSKNKPGDIWTDYITGMRFIWIPGGCYSMGQSPEEKKQLVASLGKVAYLTKFSDELPRKEICPDGFWMSVNEVTNAQFRIFKKMHHSGNFNGISLNEDTMPVVEVSWADAVEFITWLNKQYNNERYDDKRSDDEMLSSKILTTFQPVKDGLNRQNKGERILFRLPTEKEWEYACRANHQSSRFWGDNPDKACRYANVYDQFSDRYNRFQWAHHPCNDGYMVSAPVGSFIMNPFGLYDMIGNTWEWTQDIYKTYEETGSVQADQNEIFTGRRVIRGGSWLNDSSNSRCVVRGLVLQDRKNMDLGFRLVREP